MADAFDYSEDIDYEKREKLYGKLPTRLIYALSYQKSMSLKKGVHIYSLCPFIEINDGRSKSNIKLSQYYKRFYKNIFEDFERNFSFSDFQNAFFTIDQLQDIQPWKQKFDRLCSLYRPGFPDDITMEEETMFMDFAVEISPDDACKLLGKVWKEKETPKSKEQGRIEQLEGQVAELTNLLKQLLDNK